MRANRIHIPALAMALLIPSVVGHGQEAHQHHHDADEKIGKVSFAISCSAEAQVRFNRAIAWLHSFEYEEAEKAFTEVAAKDSACAMAHWGIAMSLYHQLWAPPSLTDLQKGAAAVEKARAIGAKTDRERLYILAIGEFFRSSETLDHRTRAEAHERAMEQVYRRYPSDREAAVFYALALNGTAQATVPTDKTYARQRKAAEILNRVLSQEPSHPGVAHYLIHSYDYPRLAHLALAAARSYSRIAPSSAHALHMPSHIFTRLGYWQEAVESNINSEDAAKTYAIRNHLAGAWDEQLHAMDYLEYAYLQSARDREARHVLDELSSIRNTDPESFKCAYSFAAVPARYALERRQWTEAAHLTLKPGFPWHRFRWAEAITHFARAIGAARSGDAAAAQQSVNKLTEIQQALAGARDNYDWATQVEIQRRVAAAWLSRAQGQDAKALRLIRAGADLEDSTDKHPVTPGAILPARELLGDLLLELGRPAEALKEYEASLQTSPNRFGGLYGAGRAAELAKDHNKAREFYMKLTAVCDKADGDRPELVHVKKFLAGK